MKKNLTGTLILTAVLLALFGWYFGYEKNLKSKWEKDKESFDQLITYKTDEIQELEFTRAGQPTIKLKKSDNKWLLVAPIQDEADTAAVTSMIGTLAGIKQERVVDNAPASLDTYGLTNPAIKILVRKESTSAQELMVGADTPVGFATYAKLPTGSKVYRITKGLKNGFEKDVFQLRNKNLLAVQQSDVIEVEIQHQENIVLTKGEKEQWILSREDMPADGVEWNKTLTTLLEVKATAFPAEDPKSLKEYGLDRPVVKYWIKTSKDKPRVGILIGKAGGKVYAKREDKTTIAEVDKTILDKALQGGAKYRNPALAAFNRFDTKRIRLERGKDTVELVKDKDGWGLPADPKLKIDETVVDTFLTHLQDIKVKTFVPGEKGKLPLKNPALVIRVFESIDSSEKERVSLQFQSVNKDTLAARSDLPLPFIVKAEDMKKLDLTRDSLLKKADEKQSE